MIGTIVSHYKIIDKLGAGGMGVVYKAEDMKLDRVVALKFLPQALTSDPVERERFYQEARAASQLLHPNVTAIFEINESDGQIYLAMEYVDGTTLRKRIQQENPYPPGKGLDIAIQLCTGISAAHEKGIVHRDIKSENILITPRGDLKITDFGLAKLKGATKLTKTGSTLGTAAYMSPEQARGEDVDARSDIFSCGVVLYELFTGKLPFEGEHQAAILYSLVNEEPAPLARFSSQTTPELQRIVSKALAKDKEDRYQHADEMLADLKRERKGMEYARSGFITAQAQPASSGNFAAQTSGITPAASNKMKWAVAGGVILLLVIGGYFFAGKFSGNQQSTNSSTKRIAVLPFENIGPSDKEYFADGLTDEIRTKLSGLSGLAVIARASSMQYKKTTKTVAEIGGDLNAGYLLQGTIRWEEVGNSPGTNVHLLVNPSLVKISDGTQVWSQSFEVTLSSVFQMQSDIAQQVSGALAVALNPVDKQTIESKPTTNSEAYDFYLRGLELVESFSKRDLQEGMRLFSKATELDPKFGGAYAQLCRISAFAVFVQQMPDSLLKLSKESLDKVLELEPNSYDANYAQGYYYYYAFRNYDRALRYFTPALDAQPNNTTLMNAISFVKRRQGKFQESHDLLARSSELDPQAWRTWFELGYNELVMRQYRPAVEHMKRALLVSGRKSTAVAGLHSLAIFSMSGDIKSAHEVYERDADETTSWLYRIRSAQFHQAEGNIEAAKKDLSRSVLAEPDIDSASYYLAIASIYEKTGSAAKARPFYDTARVIAKHAVLRNPNDFLGHSNLGAALAYLGDKRVAIEEGKKAVELMPLEKDPLDVGPQLLYTLAQIYAITGDSDSAIETLDRILSVPNIYSVRFIELDPDLKSLHSSPKFQKMLEKYRQAS